MNIITPNILSNNSQKTYCPVDTYRKQFLYLSLKKHGGRWGGKIERARELGVSFEIVSTVMTEATQ